MHKSKQFYHQTGFLMALCAFVSSADYTTAVVFKLPDFSRQLVNAKPPYPHLYPEL